MNNSKNNLGYKVPKGFFKNLEKNILINVRQGINIQNNYFVPYNYFNDFKPNFIYKKKSSKLKQNLLIIGSGFSVFLIIIIFIFISQNFQKEKTKVNNFYTNIETELMIKPSKVYEISRSIDKFNYESSKFNLSNFKSNQIDPNQLYFNNSFNIYYEEDDY
tara:strand:- start:518 stop:1000 length:483 start_codon:yes stop_codon:yes gene_type:complete